MKTSEAVLLFIAIVPAAPAQTTPISLEAKQTAATIGISEMMDRLEALRAETPSTDATVRRLVLREQVMEGLFQTDLDVDAVVASIQREQAQIQEAKDRISAKRDRIVNLTNIAATITGAGIGIIGTAMQFSDRTAYAGDAVGIGSGATSTFLSLLGMHLQSGGRARLGLAPNMLARIFDRTSEDISFWPADVWSYLNTLPVGGARTQTRLALLKQQWIDQGRITTDSTAREERKLDSLTSAMSQQRRLSLNTLNDRDAMLSVSERKSH